MLCDECPAAYCEPCLKEFGLLSSVKAASKWECISCDSTQFPLDDPRVLEDLQQQNFAFPQKNEGAAGNDERAQSLIGALERVEDAISEANDALNGSARVQVDVEAEMADAHPEATGEELRDLVEEEIETWQEGIEERLESLWLHQTQLQAMLEETEPGAVEK